VDWWERITASVLVFMRNITAMKIPHCLHNQITFSSETYTYPTRHATRVLSAVQNEFTKSMIAWRLPSISNYSSKQQRRGLWVDTHKHTDT
jgi:hypothetical protein